jgi:hypothetical protein
MERELTEPVDIADAQGRLRPEAIGWARQPVQRCGLSDSLGRVARWNYWCFSTRSCALTVLIADVGLIGGALVSFLDFAARRPVERLYARPGGLGFPMPDTPRGDVVVDARRLHLAMRERGEQMHVEGTARTLLGRRIDIDLIVDRPRAHETVNVLVPWDETRFQFTSKQQALPVRGVVRVDGVDHAFGPAEQGFACLDFGRGRWPSRVVWNWAFGAVAGREHTIGINLGGTWTDGTGVTENGIVIDGRLHKIHEPVAFDYDRRDFERPWRIHNERVDLTFTPLRRRVFRLPLGVISVGLHQLIGSFAGTFVDDGGRRVAIDDLPGQAEEVRARLR